MLVDAGIIVVDQIRRIFRVDAVFEQRFVRHRVAGIAQFDDSQADEVGEFLQNGVIVSA